MKKTPSKNSAIPLRFAGKRFFISGKDLNIKARGTYGWLRIEGASINEMLDGTVDVLLHDGTKPLDVAETLNAEGANIVIQTLAEFSSENLITKKLIAQYLAEDEIDRLSLHVSATVPDHLVSEVDLRKRSFFGVENYRLGFKDCDFRGALLEEFSKENWTRRKLSGGKFDKAIFKNFHLVAEHCDFRSTTFEKMQVGFIKNCQLDGLEIFHAHRMKHSSLAGATIHHQEDYWQDCNFAGATLPPIRSSITRCCLDEASFLTYAKMPVMKSWNESYEGVFNSCSMIRCRMDRMDLSHCPVLDCDLSHAVFTNTLIDHVDFTGSTLQGASFVNCILVNCNFDKANLKGADFSGACFYGHPESALREAGAIGLEKTKFRPLDHLKKPDTFIREAVFLRSSVKVDTGTRIVTVSVEASEIRMVWGKLRLYVNEKLHLETNGRTRRLTFAGAMLKLAALFPKGVPKLSSVTAQSTDSPIRGPELKKLLRACWQEAFGATEQTKEQRKSSEKRGAALREELIALLDDTPESIRIWNRRFNDVKAAGTFKDWDLSGGSMDGAKIFSFENCDFIGVSMQKVIFGHGSFNESRFTKAVLKKAKFEGSSCIYSDFTGADLSGAAFRDTDLRGSIFTKATLKGATFKGSFFDEETVWPKGFSPPAELQWDGEGADPREIAAADVRRKKEGPISFETFMERIEKTVDYSRLDKALRMLKRNRFQLYVESSDMGLHGVVKSQSDKKLVYSCGINSNGTFCCCTQNLNTCGGLRGALCKHLLVLLIGAANDEQVDTSLLDAWVERSTMQSPKIDRDRMAVILLKYKGAQAGDIDWRPTETVPEDYYAF